MKRFTVRENNMQQLASFRHVLGGSLVGLAVAVVAFVVAALVLQPTVKASSEAQTRPPGFEAGGSLEYVRVDGLELTKGDGVTSIEIVGVFRQRWLTVEVSRDTDVVEKLTIDAYQISVFRMAPERPRNDDPPPPGNR